MAIANRPITVIGMAIRSVILVGMYAAVCIGTGVVRAGFPVITSQRFTIVDTGVINTGGSIAARGLAFWLWTGGDDAVAIFVDCVPALFCIG